MRGHKVIWGILLLTLLSGCMGEAQPSTSQRVLNVGMILGSGGLGDRSFNYQDSSVEIVSDLAGTFSDPEIGKSLALAQYKAGVDVIYAAAGRTALTWGWPAI